MSAPAVPFSEQEPISAPLTGLEGRVQKAVEVIQELRRERDVLRTELQEARALCATTESTLLERSAEVTRLRSEVDSFRAEQDTVRERIQNVLAQLDSLQVE